MAFKVSKDYMISSNEIDFLANVLRKINFLVNFTEHLNDNLNLLLLPDSLILSVSKYFIYVKSSFPESITYSMERNLSNLIKTHYSTVSLKAVYTSPISIGN